MKVSRNLVRLLIVFIGKEQSFVNLNGMVMPLGSLGVKMKNVIEKIYIRSL